MEKQLNIIELANKFSKAIFFANNQEFREEQEIIIACKVLIQNAWAHANLHGEYDFNNYAANDKRFNVAKILDLNIT